MKVELMDKVFQPEGFSYSCESITIDGEPPCCLVVRKQQEEALLAYLAGIDTRYARLEAELKRALEARAGKNPKLPLGILPRSFSGSARSSR